MTQTTKAQTPPAISVALTGKYLIEASAGTGKTWTLTGIMLRLIIEARRAPEQIIATTFTRDASAEMRERVHARLLDFYQVVQWVRKLHTANQSALSQEVKEALYPEALQVIPATADDNSPPASDSKPTQPENPKPSADIPPSADTLNQLRADREQWLINHPKPTQLKDSIKDPINLYLIGYLLDHTATYSLDEAIRRTALVLTTLDKLFVGTLDSLAQKWLSEYSSETGYQQGMAIVEDGESGHIIDSIIHDELRRFQSQLHHNSPRVYDLLEQQGKLTTVKDHRGAVDKALSFMSAPIDEVESVGEFDFDEYQDLIADIIKRNHEVDSFFIEGGEYYDAIKGQLKNNRHAWTDIIEELEKFGVSAFSYIAKGNSTFKLVQAFGKTDTIYSQFYKDGKGEEKLKLINMAFNELPVVKSFKKYIEMSEMLEAYLDDTILKLNRHIAQTVRQKLPIILEEKGQTTFSLQMVRLNQALMGRQGDKLARYIRHHYPVALIDESQDINGEQAQMIKRIYLSKPLSKSSAPNNKRNVRGNEDKDNEDKGFLLLVGDPKQAIYGFRGGDVANYNDMKRSFNPQNRKTLDENRRSNRPLVNALNHWFGCPDDKNDTNTNDNPITDSESTTLLPLSNLGEDIHYQHITAFNEHPKLSWLMDLTNSESNKDTKLNPNNLNQNNEPDQNNEPLLPPAPIGLLHLPYEQDAEYDEFEITAIHIANLLDSQQSLDGKPIEPKNIAVLGRRRQDIKQVEDMLTKLGVATLKTSDVNIFETTMATDMGSLMAVMLQPYRHDMINRVLTSHLYGLCLDEVKDMMENHVRHDAIEKANSTNPASRKSYQDFISYIKKGAQRWHDYGILSALHYLLDTKVMSNVGVWQTLASLPDGDRHIMDLRHIMDIISEYSLTMREHELLTWYREQMDNPPSADWAKQHPLPIESGVRLMTIHKSKGLEFPIVYVVGLDNNSRDVKKDYALYLYNNEDNPLHNNPLQNNLLQDNLLNDNGLNGQTLNDNRPQNANTKQSLLQRRLSPKQGNATNENYYVEQANIEGYQEFKRLGYVAFTRASEQLYIVIKDDASTKTHAKSSTEKVIDAKYTRNPMRRWLYSGEQYTIPDYLQGMVADIDSLDLLYSKVDNAQKAKQNQKGDSPIQTNTQNQQDNVEKIDYSHSHFYIRHTAVIGWAKTSFTALARQLDDNTQAIAVMDERVDDAMHIDTSSGTMNTPTNIDPVLNLTNQLNIIKPADDIRFTFVRGANAGTFLHEVFEKIDFEDESIDTNQWTQIIDRAISSYQLPITYASASQQQRILQLDDAQDGTEQQTDDTAHNALKTWIREVLNTPLLASNQALKDIPANKRFAELGFNMGLADDFKPEKITELFRTKLPDDPDKHITLTAQNSAQLYRYLRGEIDLVYEHNGKYYVVDYKSNYLGNSLSNYNESTLNIAMNKAGYWLQACIYQVALHRFLSMRISNYVGNEEEYLGAVEYVFLRGTYSTEDGTRYGLVTWDIPIDFIKALDKVFGKPV